MSESEDLKNPLEGMSREEAMAALFANMVMQQTNMALMFLGKVPHPESGKEVRDLEMAQLFIDQLEMLEAKTKGNLDKREEGLLKQSLTAVRLAFVEAVQSQPAPTAGPGEPGVGTARGPETPAAAQPGQAPPASKPEAAEPEAESHKKFSKKY